jgi:energy-coupling factor transport system ATP-binding protein
VALATVERLRFSYPDVVAPALDGVSLALEEGELVALLGPSGSGKSTLLRALAGLVPHFHGGRFAGRVVVAGCDTRHTPPAELAGTVASVFQDPEDQIVLTRVAAEVAFGLENIGVAPMEIEARAADALAGVGAGHLLERPVAELSAGELQRVCLASALALRPRLLLLDEPTSQLDPNAADDFMALLPSLGCAVVCSEQRTARPLLHADRAVFMEHGRILLDAPRDEALAWLEAERPAYLPREPATVPEPKQLPGELVCRVDGVAYAYGSRRALDGASLELRRGEVVALVGANGAGKTTLAKLASGLLEPQAGRVELHGRAGYLSQDPGRYLVRERALDEVALAVGDRERASRALAQVGLGALEERHPRDLSSGERERLALAAVLVTEPDLLVLDEPTRGVDPARKSELAVLLRREASRRATLLVTHDLVFASDVADRVVELDPVQELVHA